MFQLLFLKLTIVNLKPNQIYYLSFIFNVLITVLYKILNLLDYIFDLPLFNKKDVDVSDIKKGSFIGVTLDNFLKCINSPGGRGFYKISLDMTRFVMTNTKEI